MAREARAYRLDWQTAAIVCVVVVCLTVVYVLSEGEERATLLAAMGAAGTFLGAALRPLLTSRRLGDP